jgi:hypothetical protein
VTEKTAFTINSDRGRGWEKCESGNLGTFGRDGKREWGAEWDWRKYRECGVFSIISHVYIGFRVGG